MLAHPLLQKPDAFTLWMRMLLKAAVNPVRVTVRGKPVDLRRGQLACSVVAEAEALGITRKRARYILGQFVADGMLISGHVEGHVYSVVTICNFDRYQAKSETQGPSLGPVKGQIGARLGPTEQEEEEGKKKILTPPDGGDSPTPKPTGPRSGSPPGTQLRDAVSAWNDVCGDLLGKVAKLTPTRTGHLRKRMTDDFGGSLDSWRAYCQRIRGNPFLTGDNDRGWRADFDFAISQRGCVRIHEGKYDGERKPTVNREPEDFRARMARKLRERGEHDSLN